MNSDNFKGQSSLCYFVVTILLFRTCSSTVNIIKVGLVIEHGLSRELSSYFPMIIAEHNQNASDGSIQLQGVILKWDAKKPPNQNIILVNRGIIQENLTFVLSLLGSENNAVLCDLLRGAELVMINLRDESCMTTTGVRLTFPFSKKRLNDYENF